MASTVGTAELIENLGLQINPTGIASAPTSQTLKPRPSISGDDEDLSKRTDASQPNDGQVSGGDIIMDLNSGLGVIPGFHISPRIEPQSGERHEDLISKGIISLDKGTTYFSTYKDRLDHFPYRILGDHDMVTVEQTRSSSPLLTAAVCAVGALHLASSDFDACCREFMALSASRSFAPASTIDDVKALCIGAFWLSDVSSVLVATAVRIALELQLHKSFRRAVEGDRQHYLRARLYYLVYACDHHFSVVYGRPPLTRNCEAIRDVRRFLDCKHTTEDDARIASQVSRWSICSEIFNAFGGDASRALCDEETPQLRSFSIALDSVRAEWAERFAANEHVGNYPRKGVSLQYHFAKLYLFSHLFRGHRAERVDENTSDELHDMANSAVMSALSILRTVVSDPEIQSFLNGLPAYFDTMIAFAAVFLLKISSIRPALVTMNLGDIGDLMRRLLAALVQVTASMHPRHLLVRVTSGIASLMQSCGMSNSGDTGDKAPDQSHVAHHSFEGAPDTPSKNWSQDWLMDDTFDAEFMGEYDFLFNPDVGNFI
ncbi:hypothetical protein CC79DRAFT_1332618 [Sarocladium strictum]